MYSVISYFLAGLQFVLITYICASEAVRKSSVTFMWATLLVMFGVMHTFSVFTGNSTFSASVLNKASLFVIVFCIVYIIVRTISSSKINNKIRGNFYVDSLIREREEKSVFLLLLLWICALAMIIQLIIFSGGILNSSWSTSRDYSATLNYMNANQVLSIIYFSLSGLPCYYLIQKDYKRFMLALIAVILLAIITRNRIFVIPLFVTAISFIIFKIKQLSLKHVVIGLFCGIVVIYIVYGLRVFRHYGTISVFIQSFNVHDFMAKVNLYLMTDNGELGLRNVFYYFINNNNNFENFGKGHTYLRMLLVYIPTRFSFGLKPPDFAQSMGAAIGMVAGGSTHPTLFGDCYANLGVFGVFLGGFWAYFASVMDKIVNSYKKGEYKIMAFCLVSSMYIIIGRGSVYNAFFFIAWGLPVIYGIYKIHNYLPHAIITLGKKRIL